MMIDDDTLKQLLRINDELLQLCKFLKRKARHGNFISPYTTRRRPYPHSDRSDVIEKALSDAKCVIVMGSNRSVQSRYVKDETRYALDRNKFAPVAIENVNLPFRFKGVHTPNLLGWDGSRDASKFRKLVDDISAILGPSPTAVAAVEEHRRLENERKRKVDEERFREQDRQ
jgi:TIR domain